MEIQQAKNCLEILPLEMWGEILGYLDSDNLLESRVVCKDWRKLVDDDHLPKMWKPYFPRCHLTDALYLFSRKWVGTRLSSAEDVQEFMANVEGSPRNPNPFINGTLILNCNDTKQYEGLFQVLPALLARFGNDVRSCLYFVDEQVPASALNISTILGLINLRSLTIYCESWWKVQSYLRNFNHVAESPTELDSVTVLGCDSSYFLRALFSTYRPQVKRMNWWGENSNFHSSVDIGWPALLNTEELKICNASKMGLQELEMVRWPLKRLSLKVGGSRAAADVTLGFILNSIKAFAGTLESFHLQTKKSNSGYDIPDNLTFPKVTDLRVSYYAGKNYTKEFARVFFNMKHFQIAETDDMVTEIVPISKLIVYEVKPLWRKLPKGLEMISVRWRNYSYKNARRSGTMIYKYVEDRHSYL